MSNMFVYSCTLEISSLIDAEIMSGLSTFPIQFNDTDVYLIVVVVFYFHCDLVYFIVNQTITIQETSCSLSLQLLLPFWQTPFIYFLKIMLVNNLFNSVHARITNFEIIFDKESVQCSGFLLEFLLIGKYFIFF